MRAALGESHRPLPVADEGRWFERHGRKIRLRLFMQTDFAGTVARRRSRGCRGEVLVAATISLKYNLGSKFVREEGKVYGQKKLFTREFRFAFND